MAKLVTSFIILLFLFSSACLAQIRSTDDLIGIWSGNQLKVEFVDRYKITVAFPGGTKQSGTYAADFFHTPVVLEMSFNDGNGKIEFKCLVESIQRNTIKWELFEKTADPKSFSSSFYTLTRVRN